MASTKVTSTIQRAFLVKEKIKLPGVKTFTAVHSAGYPKRKIVTLGGQAHLVSIPDQTTIVVNLRAVPHVSGEVRDYFGMKLVRMQIKNYWAPCVISGPWAFGDIQMHTFDKLIIDFSPEIVIGASDTITLSATPKIICPLLLEFAPA